ncbi:ArnT family glycosyltransferase [Haladaptatus sp. DFWS20]|uniref:ArnT family glycosyltransferase n=1 Tax=Haladaptatus sp. DFWS20 TaxID=3403467 RepID=UPI003EBECE0D
MASHQTDSKTTQDQRGLEYELPWLVPALLAGTCIFYFYVSSHSYPSFGAGLYFHIAEHISESGYALPETIPGYTAEGVPFAYPPLMFYVSAIILDVTGLSPFTVAQYLPGLVSIAYLVPLYFFARDLFGSRPQASLATLIVAVSPPVLQWHISAGGIVRAPALLFSLIGIYAGLHLFRDGDTKWLIPALITFTLTILTHPMYTIFFVLTYLLLYLRFDRSFEGLLRGLFVGLGGVLLTTPWWSSVLVAHGSTVFTAAAGTHGGIGNALPMLERLIGRQVNDSPLLVLWHIIAIAGCFWLLLKREYFLPVWLFLTVVTIEEARFVFLIAALVSSRFLFRGVVPRLHKASVVTFGREEIVTFSVVLLVTVSLSGGALYATGGLNAHAGSPSLPQFVNDGDVEAMEWTERNTSPSARFVVLGDAAEWFPQQTDRTMLVGPWGVEWKGHQQYREQLREFRRLSRCHSSNCLTVRLMQFGVHPEYVYIPKGVYTVRGMQRHQPNQMITTMMTSPQYHLAFENEEVAIFKLTDGWHPPRSGTTGPIPV